MPRWRKLTYTQARQQTVSQWTPMLSSYEIARRKWAVKVILAYYRVFINKRRYLQSKYGHLWLHKHRSKRARLDREICARLFGKKIRGELSVPLKQWHFWSHSFMCRKIDNIFNACLSTEYKQGYNHAKHMLKLERNKMIANPGLPMYFHGNKHKLCDYGNKCSLFRNINGCIFNHMETLQEGDIIGFFDWFDYLGIVVRIYSLHVTVVHLNSNAKTWNELQDHIINYSTLSQNLLSGLKIHDRKVLKSSIKSIICRRTLFRQYVNSHYNVYWTYDYIIMLALFGNIEGDFINSILFDSTSSINYQRYSTVSPRKVALISTCLERTNMSYTEWLDLTRTVPLSPVKFAESIVHTAKKFWSYNFLHLSTALQIPVQTVAAAAILEKVLNIADLERALCISNINNHLSNSEFSMIFNEHPQHYIVIYNLIALGFSALELQTILLSLYPSFKFYPDQIWHIRQ